MALRTPFYESHIEAGAKMIEFAGWEMPLHYGDILEEHRRVRGACGLFDLSHMGEIEVEGRRALEVIQLVTTNDASRLEPGQAQYSLICREDGGILDDIVVYRLPGAGLGRSDRGDNDHGDSNRGGSDYCGSAGGNDSYLLVVNAANTTKDYEWIHDKWFNRGWGISNLPDAAGSSGSDLGDMSAGWEPRESSKVITGSSPGYGPGGGLVGGAGGAGGRGGTSGGAGSYAGSGTEVRDRSSDTALLAIQGPKSQEVLQRLTGLELGKLRYYWCACGEVAGVDSLVSRTGYTGEDGFEIYFDPGRGQATRLWGAILDAGRDFGIIPCGLGARDTLRVEAGYPLYGHELTEEINPFEAGLGWVVKLDKGDFIGRGALVEAYRKPISRRLKGFKLKERGVPRPGCELRREGLPAGIVTSGTLSPTLGVGIGLGYLGFGRRRHGGSDSDGCSWGSGCSGGYGDGDDGDELSVVIRGREVRAEITRVPFVPSRVRRR